MFPAPDWEAPCWSILLSFVHDPLGFEGSPFQGAKVFDMFAPFLVPGDLDVISLCTSIGEMFIPVKGYLARGIRLIRNRSTIAGMQPEKRLYKTSRSTLSFL